MRISGRQEADRLSVVRCRMLMVWVIALGCWGAQKPPVNSAQDAQAAAQRAEKAAQAAVAAKEAAEKDRDETLKKLDAASTEMVGRATAILSMATTLTGFVAFVATAATILGGIGALTGWRSLKESRSVVRKARKNAAEIEEARKNIESSKFLLQNLKTQVATALQQVQVKNLVQGPFTPGTGLIGVGLASAIPQSAYDDDALIVLCDRLGITGKGDEELATFLVMLGNYWRRTKEYVRACERIQRAIQLHAKSASAHKELGRAMWNQVGEELAKDTRKAGPSLTAEEAALLDKALEELKEAQKLLAQNGQHDEEIAFDFATIARFRGDIRGAIDQYRNGAKLSKALAGPEGREPDWDFEFALACLFAKNRQYQEALNELRNVIGNKKSWSQERKREEGRDYKSWAQSDPDFADMYQDANWKLELDKL